MTFREMTNSVPKKPENYLPLYKYWNGMLKFQWWQGVDGCLFEGVDGAGVFLGVGEAAVSEDAGYGLDVGSVAQ